jgi:hypothetical protein
MNKKAAAAASGVSAQAKVVEPRVKKRKLLDEAFVEARRAELQQRLILDLQCTKESTTACDAHYSFD